MYHKPLTGNFAYVDNQNLYMATHRHPTDPWDIDMGRFRIYLRDKYNVIIANLFMGAFDARRRDLYTSFQRLGYVLVFRENGIDLKGAKKGNVDTDIVFEMMRDAYTAAQMKKAVLVSGDGDYYRTVEHLMAIGKMERVLLPSHRNASSLYNRIGDENRAYLDSDSMRRKIGRKNSRSG